MTHLKNVIKLLVVLFGFGITNCNSQTIGTIKTEEYRADFEKKQSLDVVSDYNGDIVIPIQILKIGINDEVYEMYPELKDKRVGLGVANIVLEYLESTDRFKFTEDKAEIKNKMIAQDKASDKGISSNKIEVKGNVILANYFVYIEVYDFSVSEDEVIKGSEGAKITQTTRLGLQIRFVDAQTGEVITGSGLGESNTVKTSSLLDDVDEIKFNQSTIGISTKKSLETASSRVVSKLIKKGVFKE
jgi:curli biogenesis system outer membrane secretion channel CsgG